MSSTVVPETDRTRVTGRRVVQYILDLFLAGLVLALIGYLGNRIAPGVGFDQVNRAPGDLGRLITLSGGWPSVTGTVATAVVWLAFFVGAPISWGRTPAMALIGLRIVRPDGTGPSAGQHAVRAVLLLLDGVAGGVVGWIVILCSPHRQRIGDHAAGTLVIRG